MQIEGGDPLLALASAAKIASSKKDGGKEGRDNKAELEGAGETKLPRIMCSVGRSADGSFFGYYAV